MIQQSENEIKKENTFSTISTLMARLEKILVCLCLGTMVVLVLIQIILRNFYNTGIVGSDSLVKHLVLWVGFLGAGLATMERSHIRIDLASKILPNGIKYYTQILVDIFSIVICGGLVYASYTFVALEYEDAGAIPFLQIPVWVMELIIPAGFLIIMLRFIGQLISNISSIKKGS